MDKVQQILGVNQIRLASETEMDKIFNDVETGAIPALRHWQGVEVIMDESMRVDGEITLQAGTHRDTVRLAFSDWYNMVQPRVGSFTEAGEYRWGPVLHRPRRSRHGSLNRHQKLKRDNGPDRS